MNYRIFSLNLVMFHRERESEYLVALQVRSWNSQSQLATFSLSLSSEIKSSLSNLYQYLRVYFSMAAMEGEVGFEEGMLWLPSQVLDEAICDTKVDIYTYTYSKFFHLYIFVLVHSKIYWVRIICVWFLNLKAYSRLQVQHHQHHHLVRAFSLLFLFLWFFFVLQQCLWKWRRRRWKFWRWDFGDSGFYYRDTFDMVLGNSRSMDRLDQLQTYSF